MMSLFNEFNFNELNFNDTTSTGGSILEISANISTESSVSSDMSVIYNIGSTIDTSSLVSGIIVSEMFSGNIETSSSVSGILNGIDIEGNVDDSNSSLIVTLNNDFIISSSDTTGESSVSGELENIISLSANIDTSSHVNNYLLLSHETINTVSSISGQLSVIYGVETGDSVDSGSTVDSSPIVQHNLSENITTESTITSPICHYDSSSEQCIYEPVLSKTLEIESTNIDTSSVVSESDLDLYFKLFNYDDDVTGSSSVSGAIYYVRGIIANIETGSSVTGRIVYETDCGGANIETGSTLPFAIEDVNIQTGSLVEGVLDAPAQLASKRREVTYIFEVEKNKNSKSIIDNHYNIMKFYYSLSGIDEVLEYTRRNSLRDLNSYRIPELVQLIDDYNKNIITELPAPYRIWSGDADLRNLNTGDRGMVQSKATGSFIQKDGHFAIYKGPKYENGQLVEN